MMDFNWWFGFAIEEFIYGFQFSIVLEDFLRINEIWRFIFKPQRKEELG